MPEEAPEEEVAPLPLGKDDAQIADEEEEEEDADRVDEILAQAAEEEAAAEDEADEVLEEESDEDSLEDDETEEDDLDEEEEAVEPADDRQAVLIDDLRSQLEKTLVAKDEAQRDRKRMTKDMDRLVQDLSDKEELLASMESEVLKTTHERDGLTQDRDQLSHDLDERQRTVSELERSFQEKEIRLEEAVQTHTQEMHRIINAYETRLKTVRAQGLKGNLIAFASAACVLLLFLVALTARERADYLIVPSPHLAGDQAIVQDSSEPLAAEVATDEQTVAQTRDTASADAPPPADDLAEELADLAAARGGGRRGLRLDTGQTFAASDEGDASDDSDVAETPGITTVVEVAPVVEDDAPPADETIRYVVKKNDTLWKLSERFLGAGKHYNEIEKTNNLTSKLLKPGQVLVIAKRNTGR